MKLYDHIQIDASPSSVWKVLADPNLMELWNPKCLRSDAGNGPYGVGFVYQASFKLGDNPERLAECMIEEYEPGASLTTKYSGSAFKRQGYVRESYRLTAKNGGTRVQQTLDFTHSEISIFIQLIMKVINAVGSAAGKGPLDGIKELAEVE